MSFLFRQVVYPAYHWVKRDGVNQAIKQLARNQWLQYSDLMDMQHRKLASLLTFVESNVPYYRRLFRDHGISFDSAVSSESLTRIPPLTKRIIRHERDRLVSEDLAGNRLHENSTSGSTGEPISFYSDFRSARYRVAAAIRSDSFTGWKLGDRRVTLWGAPMDQKRATQMRGRLHGWVTGQRFLSSFDLSPSAMDAYVREILTFKPTLMEAYPGPLEQFAIHCRDRGIIFPSWEAIVTSAETLWPHQRETIESAFGIRVFDRYGCREVGEIGTECAMHGGLHISADRLLVELVDDEDQPCARGVEGRILLTDLDNYGMPLIRYDIGDRASWAEHQSCDCGRQLPLLSKVAGRTLEIIRTTDGRQVGGTFWTLLLRSRPGLQQFQIIQDRLSGIEINFVRGDDFEESVLEFFTKRIQEYCGRDFEVAFAERESIELTDSGKRRIIVSRVANPGDSPGTQR